MRDEKAQNFNISVSTGTLIKIVGFVAAIWFIYVIRDILVIIFVAILFATAFDPVVGYLQKKKIPRTLGVIILFLAIFFILTLAVLLLMPPLIDQIRQIANLFPTYLDRLSDIFVDLKQRPETQVFANNIQDTLQSLQSTLSRSASGIFPFLSSVFGGVVSFILIFVLTFYFLSQEGAIKRGFHAVTPEKYRPYLTDLITRMQKRLVQWLRGELTLGLIIGCMALTGLWVFGIKFFLVLALIAGLSELIPYIGPVLGAIPAVFFGFMQSPWKGVAVLILYWIIQQIENHLIVPKVMQKAVGLNPIVVIIVILVGAKLLGFLGVILAVPTTAAFSVLVKDFFESNEVRAVMKKE